MRKALHLRDDVDRLYLPRKEGGSSQNNVDALIQLEEGRLITVTRKKYRQHTHQRNKNNQKSKWEETQLHVLFNRQTNDISHEKTWTRLRKVN